MKFLDLELSEWTSTPTYFRKHSLYEEYFEIFVDKLDCRLHKVHFYGKFSRLIHFYEQIFQNPSEETTKQIRLQIDNFLIKMDKLKILI